MTTYKNGTGNVPCLPIAVVDTLINAAGVAAYRGSLTYLRTEKLVHDTCEELLARLPAPADLARAGDEWRVTEYWSSANPGKRVLMLDVGADIAKHARHPDFIRWVGGSMLHGEDTQALRDRAALLQNLFEAAGNLVKVKGRYNTEQAFKRVEQAYRLAKPGAVTPLPARDDDAQCAARWRLMMKVAHDAESEEAKLMEELSQDAPDTDEIDPMFVEKIVDQAIATLAARRQKGKVTC